MPRRRDSSESTAWSTPDAAFGHERKLHQNARLLDQRMRTGVNLAERARPSLMRGKAHDAALDARLEFWIGRVICHGWSPGPGALASL